MWGITVFFNPLGFSTKLENLKYFAACARQQGLKLCVIELAHGNDAFTAQPEWADLLLQVRGLSVLWHKERLLNLALERLPANCEHVVWLDGDILFDNADWVRQTQQLLDRHSVVQPFQTAVWLPREMEYGHNGAMNVSNLLVRPGVAFARRQPGPVAEIEYRPDLAHPGFAWAARRALLTRHKIYDKFILGGGDFFIMLAMFFDSSLARHPKVASCLASGQVEDYQAWIDRFYCEVRGNVGSTPGTVFHLWHGAPENRRYLDRYRILHECHFDPRCDIRLGENGCWEWSSPKPELHRRVKEYFAARREDG